MRRILVLTVAMAVMLFGLVAPVSADRASHREGSMHLLAAGVPGAVVADTSVTVVATANRANVTVHTSGLVGGNAYTLWGFSFSTPENCIFGTEGRLCGMGDDTRPETGAALQQIAGHVVGSNGVLNFGGSIAVADAPNAEYHIVVANHGPRGSGPGMPAQIKTPGPGVQIGFILPPA